MEVSQSLSRCGKRGTFYLRRRIATQLRDADPPGKQEIICSLRTSDHALALQRLRAQMANVDQEFERRRGQYRQPVDAGRGGLDDGVSRRSAAASRSNARN